MEPGTPPLGAQSLSHWTISEVPTMFAPGEVTLARMECREEKKKNNMPSEIPLILHIGRTYNEVIWQRNIYSKTQNHKT